MQVNYRLIGYLIMIFFVLWVGSYLTLGYVYILEAICVWLASTPIAIIVFQVLTVFSIIAGLFAWVLESKKLKLFIILFVIGIIGVIVTTLYSLEHTPYMIHVERLDNPINITTLRLVPLKTAYAYAISMLQTPTHTIYYHETYIYYNNTNVVYNWIVEPEGFWNEISKKPMGVVFVDGSIYPPKVQYINRTLEWGLHRLVLTPLYPDNLYRHAKLVAGLDKRIPTDCNIEVLYNGKVYILLPAITWERGFATSIPTVAGYVVVDEKGVIKYYDIRELGKLPFFKNIPVVPDTVARNWVETYRWIYGIGNMILYHNTFEIRDVGDNPQPYLVVDDKGQLWWVFIVEPPGETYSAKYIFYINASNPKPHIYIYELPRPVIGISKIEGLIKQAHPTYDWSQFTIAEPIPIVVNGKLYWKITVITRDGRGMASIDLIDTETNKVTSIKPSGEVSMQEILSYIKLQELPETKANKTIYEIIDELREKIRQQQEILEELLQQLDELEQLVAEQGKSR